MAQLRDVQLVLFFTRGVSLETWHRVGTLERELALYRRCLPHLRGITLVSHGGRADLRHRDALGGIALVCNRWGLSRRAHRLCVGELLPRRWRRPLIVKTNQVPGGGLALRAARRAGAAFVARCGYLPGEFAERAHGADSPRAAAARQEERTVFSAADRVVVASDAMKASVVARHGIEASRIRVVPNYVDGERFRPGAGRAPDSRRVCYVGRLEEGQKNLKALLEAIDGLDVDLHLIGSGPAEGDLRRQAAERGLSVRFLGNLPHAELAGALADCGVFVLPSRYEGHPKALLEAMTCGAAVVGADAPGIRELLRHRDTGYLCGTAPESIRAALQEVLGDRALRARMGAAARAWALEHVSLERVVERELGVLRELAQEMT